MHSAKDCGADNRAFPLVSVIIPAYNAARFIKEALDSVFAQTYPYFEVMLVNDGSPDTPDLEEVLRPYIKRINYIKQENRGLSGARNSGLRAASGKLVALLDADDIWLPDYLMEQVTFLQNRPEFDLVYSDARMFGETPHAGKRYMDLFPSNGEATAAAIVSRQCHVFVSVLARREVLVTIGFDESLRSCEDFDCWIRFAAAGHRIGYQRKVLVLCRRRKDSLSADFGTMAHYKFMVLAKCSRLWPAGTREHQLVLDAIAAKNAEIETLQAKADLSRRNIPGAIAHLQAANAYYKHRKKAAVIASLRIFPNLVRAAYKMRAALLPLHRDNSFRMRK